MKHTRCADVQAFIAALTKYPEQSYVQLLNTIRDELRGKYDQKPQLSSSHREWIFWSDLMGEENGKVHDDEALSRVEDLC